MGAAHQPARSGRCRDWIKVKNIAHPAIERAMLIPLSKQGLHYPPNAR
jgi:hypothetical protein